MTTCTSERSGSASIGVVAHRPDASADQGHGAIRTKKRFLTEADEMGDHSDHHARTGRTEADAVAGLQAPHGIGKLDVIVIAGQLMAGTGSWLRSPLAVICSSCRS
jgi:hypothetical protein